MAAIILLMRMVMLNNGISKEVLKRFNEQKKMGKNENSW